MEVPQEIAAFLSENGLTAADLAASMTDALATARPWSTVPQNDRDLMLQESGLGLADQRQVRQAWDNLADHTLANAARDAVFASALARTITTKEAAALEDVSVTTITRRIARGALLAHHDPRGYLRLPSWQFTATGALPGWASVAPQLSGVPLRTVEAFLHTPQEELEGLTAHGWLSAQGDPGIVAELAQGVRQW